MIPQNGGQKLSKRYNRSTGTNHSKNPNEGHVGEIMEWSNPTVVNPIFDRRIPDTF
jgi:hypothetical protein